MHAGGLLAGGEGLEAVDAGGRGADESERRRLRRRGVRALRREPRQPEPNLHPHTPPSMRAERAAVCTATERA